MGSHLETNCTIGPQHKLSIGNIESQVSKLFLLSLGFNGLMNNQILRIKYPETKYPDFQPFKSDTESLAWNMIRLAGLDGP